MWPVLMFSSSLGSTSSRLGGSSWLRTPSKCFLHWCISSSTVLRNTPSSFISYWISSTLKPPTQPSCDLFPAPSALHVHPLASPTVSLHLPIQLLVPFTHIPPLLSCPSHVRSIFLPPFFAQLSPRSPYWSTPSYLSSPYPAPSCSTFLNLHPFILHRQVLLLNQLLQNLKSVVQHQLEPVPYLWISQLADLEMHFRCQFSGILQLAFFSLTFASNKWCLTQHLASRLATSISPSPVACLLAQSPLFLISSFVMRIGY